MKKINFKSGLIRTLPNINGLTELTQNLYKSEFTQQNDQFSRSYSSKSPKTKITQIITIKEDISLKKVNKKIKQNNLQGFILPTNLLQAALNHAPLPLSEQKQAIIESFSQMNNGALNEAEGVHLISQSKNPPYNSYAPNYTSQIASSLHFNKSSRLTLGESHLENPLTKLPYGEAVLQISHLTYHALDLDLSTEIDHNFNSKRLNSDKVMIHEYTYSIPYSLKNKNFSPHGFILHLKGKNITPKLVKEIIGYNTNGFGGLSITSGKVSGTILSTTKETKLNTKSQTKQLNESIGNFIFDPLVQDLSNGKLTTEEIGSVSSIIEGELTLVFFPLLQTFIITKE